MKNKEQNFISAVVYARNDSKEIENFIEKLNNHLKEKFLKYEIIIVNDGSTDDTKDIIKKVAKEIENASISIINMSYYQGKELAMNAGLDLAIGDFIYEFDNVVIDYPIELIFDVYKKALEGYDIVNVSPNSKRKKSSLLFYKVFNKYSNYQYKIDTETFRILSKRVINRIHAMNKTIPYRKATLANSGLKLATIKYDPLITINKKIDKSLKKERENNAFDALILFTDISHKITMTMIFVLIILTLSVSLYTIYTFINQNPIEGWTTTMLFLCFGFLGIFSIFAIIIKYLSLIVNLIFKKAEYLIESIEKLN